MKRGLFAMQIYSNSGQIWVETVIYTLIGLAIIGILLAVSKPKIDAEKDRLLIEQTIDSLNKINAKIIEVQRAPGNKRVIDVKVSKGNLLIDGKKDLISWTIDSKYKYSEPDENVTLGDLTVVTTGASPWSVKLSMEYFVDLTYEGDDELKELGGSPSSYRLSVLNNGTRNDTLQIDLRAE